MTNEQRFIITGRLPSLNEYTRACRSHWSKGAKLKQQVEAEIMWQITQARLAGKLSPVTEPVLISLEWHEKNRRRDIDNVTFGVKFILDALQRMDILINDDSRHVAGINHSIVYDGKSYIVVTIETISPEVMQEMTAAVTEREAAEKGRIG